MTPVLYIHLVSIGIWAGCVATEIVCELGQKHVAFKQSFIASLHWNIDKFVELPAILFALLTGFILLENAAWTPLLQIKVIAGLAAVVLNLVAAFTVYMRYKHFSKNNEEGYARYHLLHERVGIFCVLAIVVAVVAGGLNLTA